MAAPILVPEPQFCDADGHPYAGGSIATYLRDTTTPKATWTDPEQEALNTNPIILDAAGRCQMWGDGEYRLILRDAAGNQVWDAPATTIVSAAMAPVVAAPTIADALILLGINDLIAAEATARAAADASEQAARIAADNAERDARIAGDANLQAQIDAINATLSAPDTSSPAPLVQYGGASSDSDGHKRVEFLFPMPNNPAVIVNVVVADYEITSTSVVGDLNGFDAWFAFPMTTGITPQGSVSFYWVAVAMP